MFLLHLHLLELMKLQECRVHLLNALSVAVFMIFAMSILVVSLLIMLRMTLALHLSVCMRVLILLTLHVLWASAHHRVHGFSLMITHPLLLNVSHFLVRHHVVISLPVVHWLVFALHLHLAGVQPTLVRWVVASSLVLHLSVVRVMVVRVPATAWHLQLRWIVVFLVLLGLVRGVVLGVHFCVYIFKFLNKNGLI